MYPLSVQCPWLKGGMRWLAHIIRGPPPGFSQGLSHLDLSAENGLVFLHSPMKRRGKWMTKRQPVYVQYTVKLQIGKLRCIDIKMACPLIADGTRMQDSYLPRTCSFHYAKISPFLLQYYLFIVYLFITVFIYISIGCYFSIFECYILNLTFIFLELSLVDHKLSFPDLNIISNLPCTECALWHSLNLLYFRKCNKF